MENYVLNYLSKFYRLSILGILKSYGVSHGIFYRDKIDTLVYCDCLVKELTTVFGISELQAIHFIKLWASKIDQMSDLNRYWLLLQPISHINISLNYGDIDESVNINNIFVDYKINEI